MEPFGPLTGAPTSKPLQLPPLPWKIRESSGVSSQNKARERKKRGRENRLGRSPAGSPLAQLALPKLFIALPTKLGIYSVLFVFFGPLEFLFLFSRRKHGKISTKEKRANELEEKRDEYPVRDGEQSWEIARERELEDIQKGPERFTGVGRNRVRMLG